MTNIFVVKSIAVILFGLAPWIGPQRESPDEVAISTLRRNPLQYDDKVVRVTGWLKPETLGAFLYDDQGRAIRVRSSDEVEALSGRAQKDALYLEFWKIARQPSSNLDAKGVRVV